MMNDDIRTRNTGGCKMHVKTENNDFVIPGSIKTVLRSSVAATSRCS